MRATDFEFRYRLWVIVLIFFLAFECYAFERVSAVGWLLGALQITGPEAKAFPPGAATHVTLAIGTAFAGAGAWMRTWGTAYLNNDVVRDSAVRAERLIAIGPYRYVRNPLYLGTILMAAGIGLMASPIGWLVLMVGLILFALRLIGREEEFLLEKQGEAYREYLARVPRLWPALRPRVPAGEEQPRWGQALAGEIWMWFLFAGSAVFALTLNSKLFSYIAGGGLALGIPVRIYLRRRVERREV